MVRKHILFYGWVQGVGFRYYSVLKARSLDLTGWVRNLQDGSVEMEVQGEPERIERLIQFLRERPLIEIRYMDVRNLEPEDEYGFEEKDE